MIVLNKINTQHKLNGFTIVELLIVIVIIGILAAIVTVAYNGIQKNTTVAVMKQTLHSAATKMKLANAETETYLSSFPSDLTVPDSIGIALTTVESEKEFCINSTSQRYADVQLSITQDGVLRDGLCSGAVITSSILGNYNTSTLPAIPQTSVGTAVGDGGGFVVKTNDDWTSLNLKWDAVANATKYEIQQRSSTTGTWYYAELSNGDGPVSITSNTGNNSAYSGSVPAGTTSLDWTSTNIRPTESGQTFQYRIRPYVSGAASGTWFTATLAVPANDSFAPIASFSTNINNAWTSHGFTWTGNNTATMPGARYELQYRVSSSAVWYYVTLSSGVAPVSITSNTAKNVAYTGQIPTSTTSLTWTVKDSRPTAAGQTYEYRIRIKSATLENVYSAWTTATLAPPANGTIPTISNFNVSANNNWNEHTISWDSVGSPVAPAPRYELQYRTSSSATWYIANVSTGVGPVSVSSNTTDNAAYTAQVPISTNSFTWASADTRPTAAGQTYEYRVRVRASTVVLTDVFGAWSTATLSPPANNTIPAVTGFTVTPNAGQTNITLAWNSVSTPVAPAPRYEIQYRTTPTGTWSLANISGGAGPVSVSSNTTNNTAYTAQIPMATNSLTWTGAARPTSAGQSYDYRIRVRASSTVLTDVFGDWSPIVTASR